MKIPSYLVSELTAYALELYMGRFSTPIKVKDEFGNERYTEDAQDKYHEIRDEIEYILTENGINTENQK